MNVCKFFFTSIFNHKLNKKQAKVIRERRPLSRHVIISKWQNPDCLYPDGDLDPFQNLIGPEMDQDPSFNFFSLSFNL